MPRLTLLLVTLSLCLGACATVPSAPGSPGAPVPPVGGWRRGTETQVYPAGFVATVYTEHALSDRDSLLVRAGYNFTTRGDFGEHDHERGGGPGVGLAYRHRFAPQAESGWFAGGRFDLWFLAIDWSDDPSLSDPSGATGSSDITVFQPAVDVGYGWWQGQQRLDLTLTLGAEINVDTVGEDVGEGLVLLVGVRYSL